MEEGGAERKEEKEVKDHCCEERSVWGILVACMCGLGRGGGVCEYERVRTR